MEDIIVIDQDLREKLDLKAIGLNQEHEEIKTLLDDETTPMLGERRRVFYFLSLASGGLKYQFDFIIENHGVTQWLLLIDAAPSDFSRTWGIENKLKANGINFSIINIYNRTPQEIKEAIDSIDIAAAKKCLVYSKSNSINIAGIEAAVKLWQDKFCPDWEFEICQSGEEALRGKCAGFSKAVIIGNKIEDFSLERPERLVINPAFLFYPCDQNVQACLNKLNLWRNIRGVLHERKWDFVENYENFYIGSALYETWAEDANYNSIKYDENFVIWDSLGLPVPRVDYTDDNIKNFLSHPNFHAFKNIALNYFRMER